MRKIIKNEKVFNAIIVLIVIALYISVAMYIYSNFRERKRSELSNGIIEKVDDQIIKNNNYSSNNKPSTELKAKYNGINYTVLGKIKIKKINIYQPVLKENTKNAYNTALVKMSGPDLNTSGNVTIGGHNFMRGNFFIKINKLIKNDVVTITNISGESVNYYVYEYGETDASDVSYLSQPSEDIRIITLVTCTKGGENRYYVKAKAK